jgi:hypothetical protein
MTTSRLKASRVLTLAVVLLAGAAVIPIAVSSRTPPPREIRLVVRNMAYYLEGGSEPNPTLRVQRGEPIRVVVRSDDRGLTHDFGVDAWRVRSLPIDDKSGRVGRLEFEAPDRPGETTYSCAPHAQMMQGTIRVE